MAQNQFRIVHIGVDMKPTFEEALTFVIKQYVVVLIYLNKNCYK